VSDVSAPARTNGVLPPLRPASVAQKNKPSTMVSSYVKSIDLPVEYVAWRFWTMRQPNGCSTSAPRSSSAKHWFAQLAQKKKNLGYRFYDVKVYLSLHLGQCTSDMFVSTDDAVRGVMMLPKYLYEICAYIRRGSCRPRERLVDVCNW